jgi:hypothetical protein
MKKLSLVLSGLFFIIFSACSDNITNTNSGYMPITIENMSEYLKSITKAEKSISIGENSITSAIKQYKKPIEDMGYNFDETILHTAIVLDTPRNSRLFMAAQQVLVQIISVIQADKEGAISQGFVTKDTANKILTYWKFQGINENTIKALKLVKECQSKGNGLCTIKNYITIVLDSKFINSSKRGRQTLNAINNLTSNNFFDGKNSTASYSWIYDFGQQVHKKEFCKYLVHKDGSQINPNSFFSSHTKPFKLKEGTIVLLNSFDPWWKK